ncbi:MAG: DUF6089 family protein, partial [Flavobacteriales bacterium]
MRAQISEVGLFGGASYYIGDLNPYLHYNNTNPAGGIVFRRVYSPRVALKFNALYGRVEGYDSDANDLNRKIRNLHFKSGIIEGSVVFELNFFDYVIGDMEKAFTPYMFAGLGYFYMNPKAKLNGEWYELQPLGTEGQGTTAKPGKEKYKLHQMNVPFGVGIKANIGSRFALTVEWGFRKTFTDYLDDVGGTYADPETLRRENGPIAAELSDRS